MNNFALEGKHVNFVSSEEEIILREFIHRINNFTVDYQDERVFCNKTLKYLQQTCKQVSLFDYS